jgi:hypothetical protein
MRTYTFWPWFSLQSCQYLVSRFSTGWFGDVRSENCENEERSRPLLRGEVVRIMTSSLFLFVLFLHSVECYLVASRYFWVLRIDRSRPLLRGEVNDSSSFFLFVLFHSVECHLVLYYVVCCVLCLWYCCLLPGIISGVVSRPQQYSTVRAQIQRNRYARYSLILST